MTIASITRVPEVGEVGVKASFLASGDKVGTDVRWYLAFGPVSSKLPTLATVTTAKRADARLKVDASAAGYFTPDVPGHYQVECHDVTIVRTPRKYSDAPPVADTDNDFAGAPVVDLSSGGGAARYGSGELRVVQNLTRTIGQAPDTMAITLRFHDRLEYAAPDAVTLVPSPTRLAELSIYDDQIRGVVALLREARVTSSGGIAQFLGSSLVPAYFDWNGHLGAGATAWTVHTTIDATNTAPASSVTTLAAALTQLAALRTAYNAHRASAGFHAVADTTNAFRSAVANPTTVAEAADFCRQFFQILVYGSSEEAQLQNDASVAITGHFIASSVHAAPGDPYGNSTFDFSSTETGVIAATNRLTVLYNGHRIRGSLTGPHVAADTDNVLVRPPADDMTLPDIVAWANAWADSIERHTADVYRDSTGTIVPFATAKHQNTRPIKIGQRASNLVSAVEVVELCQVAWETHVLDGGTAAAAHVQPQLGRRVRNGPFPLMTRLQRHWIRMTRAGLASVPLHMNTGATTLVSLGWK